MINEYPSILYYTILYYTILYYPSYLLLKTLLVLRNLCVRKKMENCELHAERVVLFVSRLRQAIYFFSLLFSQLYCHIFLVGYKGTEMEALEKRDNQLRLERRESRQVAARHIIESAKSDKRCFFLLLFYKGIQPITHIFTKPLTYGAPYQIIKKGQLDDIFIGFESFFDLTRGSSTVEPMPPCTGSLASECSQL